MKEKEVRQTKESEQGKEKRREEKKNSWRKGKRELVKGREDKGATGI